jgi:hypothetical protein
MDNITPIATEILALTAQMAPLEARLEVLKGQLRDAAQPATYTVAGVGKVTLAAAVPEGSKTELVLDVAKFEASDAEVTVWLRENGLVFDKVTKTPARKSAVKVTLNA